MHPDSTHIELVRSMHGFWHELEPYFWLVVIMFLGKSYLEQMVAGALWHWKSDYDNLDLVKIGDDYGRIQHIGMFKTKFTFYTIDESGRPVGGWSCEILNSELRYMVIKKLLSNIEIPQEIRSIYTSQQKLKADGIGHE